MKIEIVNSLEPITLVGGAALGEGDLALAQSIAPQVIAADGGADQVLAAGVEVSAVIGDMDSVSETTLARVPNDRIHRVSEQQSTDFDKALRSIQAPVVIGVGFTGGRIDHQMGALHTLVARADRPCVLIGSEEILFHCPPRFALPTGAGDVVSLFPMTQVAGRSTGLEWPIDGLSFDPARFIGTSNRALGPVELEMERPGMLVVVRRGLIRPVVRSLARLAPPERWPAP